MPGRAQPAAANKGAAKPPSGFRRLRPTVVWACAAIVAVSCAVLAGESNAGAQRLAAVTSALNLGSAQSFHKEKAAAEAEAVTRQLSQNVRSLSDDQARLTRRLAAVEQNLDDMTGSVTRQIEAVKQPQSPPWPDDKTPMTMAELAAMLAQPTAGNANPLANPLASASLDASVSAAPANAYGADIGGALTIKSLHARWISLRTAHPQLFEGLRPSVTIRENVKSSHSELRLVVGPFANAEGAAQLCFSLVALKLSCLPTMFDGRLALQ